MADMDSGQKHTYTSQIVAYVHESLRSGLYSPGMQLTEQMLADALGASRAPIREALQTLANEGLVTSFPYKGRVIRKMSIPEILDNAYLVGVIEGALAIRALPYQTDDDFARMEKVVAEMEVVAMQSRDMLQMENLADEFHQLLCGRRHLADFTYSTRRICRNVSRILYYKYWKRIFTLEQRARRHRFLLDGLLTRDSMYIDAIIRRHQMEVGEGICRQIRNDMPLAFATAQCPQADAAGGGAK